MTEKNQTLESNLKKGTIVVAIYGHNRLTNKPFQELYELGHYTKNGAVVHPRGKRSMQSSYTFNISKIREANEEELKTIPWGN